MRPFLVLLAALLAAPVCSSAETAATHLVIRAWPDGKTSRRPHRWTLTCPAAGTLPRPEAACRRLTGLAHPFAGVPLNAACTQIYGGPAVALVTGTFRGHTIQARFARGDGCQIARWNRVEFLFPGVAKP